MTAASGPTDTASAGALPRAARHETAATWSHQPEIPRTAALARAHARGSRARPASARAPARSGGHQKGEDVFTRHDRNPLRHRPSARAAAEPTCRELGVAPARAELPARYPDGGSCVAPPGLIRARGNPRSGRGRARPGVRAADELRA